MKIIKLIFFILLGYSSCFYLSHFKANTHVIKENDEEVLKDYLISVISCEMPASYEIDALKAQAIAARSYYYYTKDVLNRDITTSDQCTSTVDEMKAKWGNDFDKYYNKIEEAVVSTSNLVVLKNNSLFKTYYFSTSNGHTNDSSFVFKENTISGVDSSFDKSSKDYLKEVTMSKDDLVSILGNFNNITIKSRDNNNNVTEISIDDSIISGIKFRSLLKLRSTDFDIKYIDNQYIFTTRGYGHGVGLSQYGANYLAKNNKDYEYILKYYYGDIDIKKHFI